MAHVAKTDVFQIPSSSRDIKSQRIDWRAVTSDIARSPGPWTIRITRRRLSYVWRPDWVSIAQWAVVLAICIAWGAALVFGVIAFVGAVS